ncbi:MAG TPA: polymer-forming cytoskeletal protein [Hyphomicrobiaceae bacterium]|nr:polymer-forming cytoskeletal protein [Hyphomicrobiaceae bacterium]
MVFKRTADVRPTSTEPPFPMQSVRTDGSHWNSGQASAAPAASHSRSRTHTDDEEVSVIGNDLSIEGQSITIRCRGSLRVNGNIQADLHSMQLEVGADGSINGSITAETVDVHGKVNGAIRGVNVHLRSTSQVDGEVWSQTLSIEQGASFEGRSRKVTDPAEIAPQLTPNGRAGPPPLR